MKARCRQVRTSVDRIAGIGASFEKGEHRQLSAQKSFETGSQNRFQKRLRARKLPAELPSVPAGE